MKSKIIIDTDPGVDDAVALMMAANIKAFEILAVTTVCGNTTIQNTTRNARFILDTIGLDKVFLAQGADKPLDRALKTATVHGDDGLLGIAPKDAVKTDGEAVETILRLVNTYPDEVTIVAIGPLTNIASAIRQSPVIMSKVKNIIIMGGTLNAPGNMPNGAEFNFFVDPEAARIVCAFPTTKVLIPLDVCNLAVVDPKEIVTMKDSDTKTLLECMIGPYAENIYTDTGIQGAVMYDPLAIYYVAHSEDFVLKNLNISVSTDDTNRGAVTTIKGGKSSSNVKVATGFTEGFYFSDAFKKLM